jgi:hypothetical protein
MFSNDIVEAVKVLTKERYEQYQKYIARVKTNAWATIVKIADLNHNADISRIKNPQDKDVLRINKYVKAMSYLTEEKIDYIGTVPSLINCIFKGKPKFFLYIERGKYC